MSHGQQREVRLLSLRYVLTAIALIGIGAAVTAAAWVDDVSFGANAQAASFDIQARTSALGDWQDVGLPGDPDSALPGNEIVLDGIEDAHPGTSYAVPIYLCNDGTIDGKIASAEISVDGTLVDLASVNVDTISVGTELPAKSCNAVDQVAGFVQLTTTSDWTEKEFTIDVIRLFIHCEPL